MTQYWILSRSLTHAQRAAKLLERSGMTATVIKAPQGMNTKGCGYAVTLRKRIQEAVALLRRYEIPFGKIFERTASGEYREVLL